MGSPLIAFRTSWLEPVRGVSVQSRGTTSATTLKVAMSNEERNSLFGSTDCRSSNILHSHQKAEVAGTGEVACSCGILIHLTFKVAVW